MNNKLNKNLKLQDIIFQNELFDLYHSLLNKQQSKYFKLYYEKNLTYSEIAKTFKISRAAVGDSINKTKKLLKKYESKLNLLFFKKRRISLYNEIADKKVKEKLLQLENCKDMLC